MRHGSRQRFDICNESACHCSPDSFDPQTDPIVRVEATRLRRALAQYYAGEGSGDAMTIDLPRGCYVPAFQLRLPHPPQAGPKWLRAVRSLQRFLQLRLTIDAPAERR